MIRHIKAGINFARLRVKKCRYRNCTNSIIRLKWRNPSWNKKYWYCNKGCAQSESSRRKPHPDDLAELKKIENEVRGYLDDVDRRDSYSIESMMKIAPHMKYSRKYGSKSQRDSRIIGHLNASNRDLA